MSLKKPYKMKGQEEFARKIKELIAAEQNINAEDVVAFVIPMMLKCKECGIPHKCVMFASSDDTELINGILLTALSLLRDCDDDVKKTTEAELELTKFLSRGYL